MDSQVNHANCRGYPQALPITGLIGVVLVCVTLIFKGLSGVFLLYMAIVPVSLILFCLRHRHESDLSAAQAIEFFWLGSLVSIGVAFLLESIGQFQTRAIWRCQRSDNWTWGCNGAFVLSVLIIVGLSEEFAKVLPLSLTRVREEHIPNVWSSWFRVVDSPFGLFIAAGACSAGFATIENIKYTTSVGMSNLEMGIDTSLFRGILAVPFHIACTCYIAAQYCHVLFADTRKLLPSDQPSDSSTSTFFRTVTESLLCVPTSSSSSESASRMVPVLINVETRSKLEKTLPFSSSSMLLQAATSSTGEQHVQGYERCWVHSQLLSSPTSLRKWMSILALPVILHGMYDVGLFAAAQFIATANREQQKFVIINSGQQTATDASSGIFPIGGGSSSDSLNSYAQDSVYNDHNYLNSHRSFLSLIQWASPNFITRDILFTLSSCSVKETTFDFNDNPEKYHQWLPPPDRLTGDDGSSDFYLSLAIVGVAVSFLSYSIMIVLFGLQWIYLTRMNRNSIIKLVCHVDYEPVDNSPSSLYSGAPGYQPAGQGLTYNNAPHNSAYLGLDRSQIVVQSSV